MPPPTNEEQAQQQKMMSFMMIFMGAMFFRVPSGLCLYFIATNIWSMTERWLFEHLKKNKPVVDDAPVTNLATQPNVPSKKVEEEKPSVIGGIWDRLQKSADNQITATRQLESNRDDKRKKKRDK